MAHEITERDKLFSVRKPTWHGLEELLPEYPSRAEAEKLVHDFDVIREPLYRKQYTIEDGVSLGESFVLLPEFELNVRSDTATELAVVPTDRVDVQPSEMWDLAELIQGEDKNVIFETAGTLDEGRKLWILIRLNEPVEIQGDPNGASLPYFALQNGYAPGSGFRGQATNVRIVCANTSRASDMLAEAKGVNFSFAHTANLRDRVEQIREALEGWRHSISEWKLAKEWMVQQEVTVEGMNWFVEQFIPAPHGLLTTARVKENIETARVELLFELFNGMNSGITHTSLGLFEAASSWSEHIRAAQTPLSRFKRSMLDSSDILFSARELALEAATI